MILTGCSGQSTDLFDGKSLDGWKCDPEELTSHWKAEDGELVGENPDEQASILWTTEEYQDFEVELEYITQSKDYDSGLFLRGMSHQVQIGISRSLQKDLTGCIYAPIDNQGSYPGQTDKVETFHRVGEWNHLKVILKGNRIQTFLNGEPFVDYRALNLVSEGPIGLQLHGGVHMDIKFRNVRIREIERESVDFSSYPNVQLSSGEVIMKVYLPDKEKGLYRGTRFDWSGVIGSAQYKGHEYFGYWKETHDPMFHEDLAGPVEGFIAPGPGYEEAEAGDGFIRIGVGVLEKEDEEAYNWRKTYRILDHGTWKITRQDDWITFVHELDSDFGYGYVYTKTIQLKQDGFVIKHTLHNTGDKVIETDQFNHNFFMIDGEPSGTPFQISFPYAIRTADDMRGLLTIEDRELSFIRDLDKGEAIFVELEGYNKEDTSHHKVTVLNRKSGAGVTFTVDKPMARMAFWSCQTTLSPENSVRLSVEPGQEEHWNSDYTFFVK